MKRHSVKYITIAALIAGGLTSCTKKLDLLPTNDVTAAQVYSTPEGYKQAFAKVYGAYALTGNKGPAGDDNTKDIQGIDEGTSDFFRLYWCAEELPTDEAVVGWGDVGLPDFHSMTWSSSNTFLTGLYYRCMYQITLANDFIRQSSDANLSSRGIKGADADKVHQYVAEVRFLRAYQYSILMDLFAAPPFVTENDPLGGPLPKQISRKDLFTYVEGELKAIDGSLADARTNEYGRADKAAAWALLARIYLNAEVYTGTANYAAAVTYSKKVIDAGYSLVSDYTKLMRADNHLNKNEFILTINYDGLHTQSYGGATFMTHAPVGGSMPAADYGIAGGWAGLRTTKAFVNLFPGGASSADKRAQFYTDGQNIDINTISTFTDGYAISKFKDIKINGGAPQSLDYADMDLPIFRLAEQYLIYAEATTRGGGGDAALALSYVNKLRARAYQSATTGQLTALTTDLLLDERGRELYWEGFRRTDLIRYKKFVEATYLWPFKGGSKDGKGVESFRTVYPLPSADVTANPNLKQNTGY